MMRTARSILAAATLMLAVSAMPAAAPALAGPEAELWQRWTAHDPSSDRRVDHDAWGALLSVLSREGPDGVRRVDYGAITGETRTKLDRYLETLQAVPVSQLARAEQFAYWVNLYNALTVQVIAEHYPVDSIRDIDISPGWFSNGPWGAELVTVEGAALSLDDIEHRILRPIWQDPRIHYAVNCASIGCPDLAPDPWTSEGLDARLDAAARAYVNHPRGARVEDDGGLVVSKIYSWFIEDFGGSEVGVLDHLRRHADTDLAAALAGRDGFDGTAYDWSLNDIE
jgi:hypothetical protein